MSEKNQKPISFLLQRIETTQFAILQTEIGEQNLAYEINFGFGINPDVRFVRSTFRYDLLSDKKPCVIIEVAIDFLIEPECFETRMKKSGQLLIEKGFATHLAMIAVGTTRGILHEKTRETPLNNYPIPTIDVTKQIIHDITFDL